VFSSVRSAARSIVDRKGSAPGPAGWADNAPLDLTVGQWRGKNRVQKWGKFASLILCIACCHINLCLVSMLTIEIWCVSLVLLHQLSIFVMMNCSSRVAGWKFTSKLADCVVVMWSEDECKETDSGTGYSGDLARSASGRRCYTWNNLDSYVRNHLWKSHDHLITVLNVSLFNEDGGLNGHTECGSTHCTNCSTGARRMQGHVFRISVVVRTILFHWWLMDEELHVYNGCGRT